MDGIYDIHTHILYGVDDGAASLRESLQILEDEVEQGVRGILLTPHYRKGMFEPEEVLIRSRCREVLREAEQRYPELSFGLGCELHADRGMEETLEKRSHCTIGRTGTVLLEFSAGHSLAYIKERTERLLQLGYTPILAHMERYQALYGQRRQIEDLRQQGVRLQINANSVLGQNGWKVQHFCRTLLRKQLIDYVASDVHNMTDRPSRIGEAAAFIEKKYGREYAHRLFVENPVKLFASRVGK